MYRILIVDDSYSKSNTANIVEFNTPDYNGKTIATINWRINGYSWRRKIKKEIKIINY